MRLVGGKYQCAWCGAELDAVRALVLDGEEIHRCEKPESN
jgi:hypothetical protein